MRKIPLTMLFVFSMVFTTGYKTVSETMNIQAREYKIIPFSKNEVFEKYIKMSPHSVQIYFHTKKYCKEFNVPEEVAFSVARLETNYRGPDMFHYKPNQTSVADAYGTYQILLSTARYVVKIYPDVFPEISYKDVTKELLLTDVHLNTKIGIKYLRHLHSEYNSWIIACGFYNTGYPRVNQYAKDAVKYLNV